MTKHRRDTPEFARGLTFFDAVYGFALTLLVTTIDVSGVDTWRSLHALLQANGTQLKSFAISFIVIVAFWRWNHSRLARCDAMDSVVLNANAVTLGFVILIPLSTEAVGDPDLEHLPLPTALYAVNIAAATLAGTAMFQLALRRGLVRGDDPPAAIRAALWDDLTTPAVFLLSIPITYLGVSWWGTATPGQLFWLLLVAVGPLSGRRAGRVIRRARAEAGLDVGGGRADHG